jgi:demethylmenaquinone methyltransferase/2-methoxy-6-polyprenyl-1,4-benzoquinol methylase
LLGLPKETWKKVIRAIEDSIPLYDQVNDLISFGKAQVARRYAIQNLQLQDNSMILDSGIGPGTTSRSILSKIKPSMLVGLDESVIQLKTAKANLASVELLNLVRGSFEYLPFRNEIFNAIITCYALRDSLDLAQSVTEYARVCTTAGAFADVDIGKPDSALKRWGSILYIRYFMPMIAKIVISSKLKGNPWRMIGPTYTSLPRTSIILSLVRQHFARTELKEFLMGGVVVIIGRKS